jgi:hypothetical protein
LRGELFWGQIEVRPPVVGLFYYLGDGFHFWMVDEFEMIGGDSADCVLSEVVVLVPVLSEDGEGGGELRDHCPELLFGQDVVAVFSGEEVAPETLAFQEDVGFIVVDVNRADVGLSEYPLIYRGCRIDY